MTSALVAEHPTFADYWAWRADAVAGKGELEQAAFDYRQALAIYPNNAVVDFAELARRRGRPCEGVFALSRFIEVVSTARAWVHDLRIKSNVRELEGALIRLAAYSSLSRPPP